MRVLATEACRLHSCMTTSKIGRNSDALMRAQRVNNGREGREEVENAIMPQRKLGCSARRAVALSADGAVLTACWGSDPCPTAFSLEDGETRLAADEVAGADGHLLALADGRVFSWGQGQHGALGLGSRDDRATPTLVGGLLSGRRMTAVSCGAFFSLALDAMGRVFWWGDGKALLPQELSLIHI